MKTLTIRAKQSFKNLEGIFQKGDVLTMNIFLYDEDTKIANALYGIIDKHSTDGFILHSSDKIIDHDKLPKNVWKFCNPVIAKKGSYKRSTLTTSAGVTYDSNIITHAIGYKKLRDLFDIVPQDSVSLSEFNVTN